ncbi:hypothetical protein DRJ22_02410 [Candidatus Woesearchaeota archaeon]|nr:MAG: hypothetical protein B6U93_01625 [Candidatus Woesearchaeota archaeon ex4484_78]RLE46275.1 MAG: hypothetical protein DRJ22_02410 [Candidatus Woesearchaeota archaeon]
MAKKKSLSIKKKHWVNIHAPKIFNEQVIGETYTSDVDSMINRFLSVSLANITNEPQKQNISIKFKITGVKEGSLETEVYGLSMLPAAVKRLVRRNRCKIDDSFVVQTKDKKVVRIKPIVLTRGKPTSSVLSAMKKFVRAHIALRFSKLNFNDFVQEVINKRFHHDLLKPLKKIYPVAVFEIREFSVVPPEKKKVKILRPVQKQETKPETKKEEKPEKQEKN